MPGSDIGKTDLFGALATLENAGFERGDFLPLYTFTPMNARYVSTTSTTWTGDGDLNRWK